jgi:hypothetical protein
VQKAWKTIASIVPGPAVVWVGKWLDLFSRTHLTYPEWQDDAQNTAAAVGTFVAIIICLTLNGVRRTLLKWMTLLGSIATLSLLAACWTLWFQLGKAMPAAEVMLRQDIWKGLYITAMVMMVATISVGALSLREESSKIFWVVVGVAALLIVVIVVTVLVLFRPINAG